jgi:hypothetical protein
VTNRLILIALTAALLLTAPARAAVRETTDDDIDRAIARVKRYLWSQQNSEGHWQKTHYEYRHHLPGGFTTAIVVYALLESGETIHNDQRVRKAVDALVNMNVNSIRVRSLRAMALGRVVATDPEGRNSPYFRKLVEDLKWLLIGQKRTRFTGAWGDTGPARIGDNMSGQFALGAMWETQQAGIDLKKGIFRLVEETWISRQQDDGGWTLDGDPKTSMETDVRMTAAAMTSLYICWDALEKDSGKYKHQEVLEKGWTYLDKHFTENFVDNSYSAFCIQQLGMLSGQKFIGKHDWYAIAARKLAEPKPGGAAYKGYWGPLVRAAFELILLAKGRIPLTFNKLDYGQGTPWNFHSRDVARFTEYMKRQLERPMRWQVVTLQYDVQSLLDAPIMIVEGNKSLKLSDEEWGILREYTLRGGTLLFIPSRNSRPFKQSVVEAVKKLYTPQRKSAGRYYELAPLPENHPVYSIHEKFGRFAKRYGLEALTDGTRPLLLISERDIAQAWQRKAETVMKRDFKLGANLFLYVTGQNNLSSRMRPVFAGLSDAKAIHSTRVGWLKHTGNWNTQPYALDYVSDKLTAENRVKLEITRGVDPAKDNLTPYTLLWMTGTDAFSLSEKAVEQLRNYIKQGGTLAVNAVGGSDDFARSARAMLDKIFLNEPDIEHGNVSVTSPLMTGKCGDFRGPQLKDLSVTRALRRPGGLGTQPMDVYKILGKGRALAIFMPFGVHDTLDGHTAYSAQSYMPRSAQSIAANIVLYAMTSTDE